MNGYIFINLINFLGKYIIINVYIDSNKNETIHVFIDRKVDSQCFSNKCVNHTFTYNAKANIERCNTLYVKSSIFILGLRPKHYTQYSRMLDDSYLYNEECSFNVEINFMI
ncbi:hypothetical protein BCR36DRAFT_367352 [Piromyces finnis]|uniref:Uncharacterized protein n=1 Tax=Piromyces finnis TaxID=1754191 RepID=A0A1Y1VIQ9_9FUNG|nr:hypothetical protein BCR36DRAFT_367352 [Piromyces finnis]|eukprot:ORX57286.1 hypothetical protein BCR36DRAFT_367352 [Piromyces finnis]